MNVKQKAREFAMKAHKGQIRKSEPDKPMIIHPLSVGEMLESYGYDEQVVAAGYLHDVVEDTPYTLKDIEHFFGADIAALVCSASEPDKSLSWEERKKHTIEITKNLPLRNKLIICADKINNLEDLNRLFIQNGKRDFSAFKRGEQAQKWYYENVYQSLILNEDENLQIFRRLKSAIENVFEDEKAKSNHDLQMKLNAQKQELIQLRKVIKPRSPILMEFIPIPSNYQPLIVANLYDFFLTNGFRIELFTNPKTLNFENTTLEQREEQLNRVAESLTLEKAKASDIIITKNSLNTFQLENLFEYQQTNTIITDYFIWSDQCSRYSKQLIDFLAILWNSEFQKNCTDQKTLAKIKTSIQNVKCLENVWQDSIDHYLLLDGVNLSSEEILTKILLSLLPVMRENYIRSLKKEIEHDE